MPWQDQANHARTAPEDPTLGTKHASGLGELGTSDEAGTDNQFRRQVMPNSQKSRLESRDLGPDVFLADRAVGPLGDSYHSASAFELSNDTGPLSGSK